jgi:nucleotide-binding universal stress UspA family protein
MKKVNEENKAERVIWAMDAFHDQPRKQLRAVEAFLKMQGRVPAHIQPVAVLSSGMYDPRTRSFMPAWREVASRALRNLERSLGTLSIPGLQRPRLVQAEAGSVTDTVHALIRVGLEESASLILVSSHARRGVARLFMGSFAETLVMHSPFPVLVVNPASRAHQRMRSFLFPTDFSEASRAAFNRLAPLAARLGMRIVIFHKVPLAMTSIQATLMDPRKEARPWIQYAEKSGVKAKLRLGSGPSSLRDDILDAALELGPTAMLAMTSKRGPVTSALVGSVTRQVLRSALCPVLVFHSDQHSLLKEFAQATRQLAFEYSAHPVMT